MERAHIIDFLLPTRCPDGTLFEFLLVPSGRLVGSSIGNLFHVPLGTFRAEARFDLHQDNLTRIEDKVEKTEFSLLPLHKHRRFRNANSELSTYRINCSLRHDVGTRF